jgi:hypothetical protein
MCRSNSIAMGDRTALTHVVVDRDLILASGRRMGIPILRN